VYGLALIFVPRMVRSAEPPAAKGGS